MNVEQAEKLLRKKSKEHYEMVINPPLTENTDYWVERTVKHVQAEVAAEFFKDSLRMLWSRFPPED